MTEQYYKPEELNPEELQSSKLNTEEIEDTLDNDEPTEEELKAEYIKQLKESRIRFRPLSNGIKTVSETRVSSKFGHIKTERTQEVQTNITVNKFDKKYKQKRKKKNKLTKASRKANRK